MKIDNYLSKANQTFDPRLPEGGGVNPTFFCNNSSTIKDTETNWLIFNELRTDRIIKSNLKISPK